MFIWPEDCGELLLSPRLIFLFVTRQLSLCNSAHVLTRYVFVFVLFFSSAAFLLLKKKQNTTKHKRLIKMIIVAVGANED